MVHLTNQELHDAIILNEDLNFKGKFRTSCGIQGGITQYSNLFNCSGSKC